MKNIQKQFLFLALLLLSIGAKAQTQGTHVLSYLPYTPCAGAPINFYAVDTAGIYTQSYMYWSFGDGSSMYSNSLQPNVTHTYSSPGTYYVNFFSWDSLSNASDSLFFQIVVDSICTSHDNISGTTYLDANGNGAQDPGESIWANRPINIQPGNYFITSDANGNWAVNLPAGNYTFTCLPAQYYQVTQPATNSYSVTSLGNSSSHPGNDFGLNPIPGQNDLRISYSSAPPVPGFNRSYYLTYSNVGTTVLSATVTFDYDPSLGFINASPGGSNTGSTVTWSLPNLAPGSNGFVNCVLNIPVTTVIGSALPFTATINPISGDVAPADNQDARDVIVLASYDPNDKAGLPAGQGSTGDIAPGTRLSYTVRFQNVGTFYATNVVIRDTLDADLDQSTLEVIGASHPFTWHNDFGKLAFEFNNINLPQASLDEPGSHGFVMYKISPKSTLPLGSELTNTASIYFDFNPAIVTNTTLHTLANLVAVASGHDPMHVQIAPNPFTGHATVRFDNPNAQLHTFKVLDLSGRVLLENKGIQGGQFELNGSDLSTGMYLYSIESADGKLATGKLVVQ